MKSRAKINRPSILLIGLILGVLYLILQKSSVLKNVTYFPLLNLPKLESLIDNNQNVWSEYQDQVFTFKYPMYLSAFNDISATELTTKGERIANYFRSSNGIGGSGRSYWIIIMKKDPSKKTAGLDITDWIINNKLNRDEVAKQTRPINKTLLGGKDAYVISIQDEEVKVPRGEKVYFQTREGIASVGFWSHSTGATLKQDYRVFKDILSTFQFIE